MTDAGLATQKVKLQFMFGTERKEYPPSPIDKTVEAVFQMDTVAIQMISLALNDCSIDIRRNPKAGEQALYVLFDRISIHPSETSTADHLAMLMDACRRRFSPLDRNPLFDQLNDQQKAYTVERTSSLHRLEYRSIYRNRPLEYPETHDCCNPALLVPRSGTNRQCRCPVWL